MKTEFYLKQNMKPMSFPEESKKLAELIGIILGDGNVNECKSNGKLLYQLRIACHVNDDKEYYQNHITPLLYGLFGIKACIYYHKNKAAVHIYSSRKMLVKFLISKGLKFGNKKYNNVTIPAWIQCNPSYLKSCIRRLFDTDGSVFRMSNKDPQLIRVSFCNYDVALINTVRASLISLGYHPSKIINHNIHLSRKADVAKYLNEIGFSNPKHLNRLKRMIAP